MKAKDIEIGGIYIAKVSGRVVEVRVDRIEEESQRLATYGGYLPQRYRTARRYYCTNLATQRQVTFRSAARFRGRVVQRTEHHFNGK